VPWLFAVGFRKKGIPVQTHKAYKRTRNLFDPQSKAPFKLSRSRLENFINCPRCFYLDRRLGIEPPGIPAFTLNSAVDQLLKKEFDTYRRKKIPHPLMKKYNIDAVPFDHPMLGEWRENFKGVQIHHRPTNLIISGAVDDLWVNPSGELFVVDYKSTSTNDPIDLDGEYKQAYKRQMEIYQWLLRQLDFKVAATGYFVYCNADKSRDSFDGKLEFALEIISYTGNTGWVEDAVAAAHGCLIKDALPEYTNDCEHCNYRQLAAATEEHGAPEMAVKKPRKERKVYQGQGDLFEG